MNFFTSTLFVAALCAAIFLQAQAPVVTTQLSASYRKYTNRIELMWTAAPANQRYIVLRRDKRQTSFKAIDTVAQNRYVDRRDLRTDTDYWYRVQAVNTDGTASVLSPEAVGALLTVAEIQNRAKDTLQLKDCADLKVTDAKSTATFWAVKYLMRVRCTSQLPDTLQLTLFYSPDATLDDTDVVLARQSVELRRTRGAITVPNADKRPASGHLFVRIEAGTATLVQGKKIE